MKNKLQIYEKFRNSNNKEKQIKYKDVNNT